MNDDAVMVERDGEDRHETVGPEPSHPVRERYDTHRVGRVWFAVGIVLFLALSKVAAEVLG